MRAFPRHLARDFRELIDLNLSGKCANGTAWLQQMRADLDKHLAPRRGQTERRREKARSWKKKLEARGTVRELVRVRANGRCECGCGRWFKGFGGRATLDHFFGVAKAESFETCWMLRLDCHTEKSDEKPDRETWVKKFVTHVTALRYLAYLEDDDAREHACAQALADAEKMLGKVDDRAALDAARVAAGGAR